MGGSVKGTMRYLPLILLQAILVLGVSAAQDKDEVQPADLRLAGQRGEQVSPGFVLLSGLSIFEMTHGGRDRFSVDLLNVKGRSVATLFRADGAFSGSKALRIDYPGVYNLGIVSSGGWSATIRQPRAVWASKIVSFHGSAQAATPLFQLDRGEWAFRMTHEGDGSFAPVLLDRDGNQVATLADTEGEFDGTSVVTIYRGGIHIIDVAADGDWTIRIE